MGYFLPLFLQIVFLPLHPSPLFLRCSLCTLVHLIVSCRLLRLYSFFKLFFFPIFRLDVSIDPLFGFLFLSSACLNLLLNPSNDFKNFSYCSLLLWLSSIPLQVLYIYIYLTSSYVDGHLGCFLVLALVNCAAMNIGVLYAQDQDFWMI